MLMLYLECKLYSIKSLNKNIEKYILVLGRGDMLRCCLLVGLIASQYNHRPTYVSEYYHHKTGSSALKVKLVSFAVLWKET